MRKVVAAILAVPVLAIIYFPVVARRPIAARAALLASVGIVVGVAAFGLARPAPTTATPPSPPIRALPAEAFRSVAAGIDLHATVPIEFSEAMDPTSVAAALTVEPAAAVEMHWSTDRRTLTVEPATHWPAATYEVVTVEPGALAASGRPMAAVVRATFVTRAQTNGRLETTTAAGRATSMRTDVRLSFDRPVTARAVAAAIRTTPAVRGSVTVVPEGADSTSTQGKVLMFTPDLPLAAATTYTVTLDGLADVDGAPVSAAGRLAFTTTAAPSVVRFRPANGATKVDPKSALSIRFTEPMNHATTRSAVAVTANGAGVPGTVSFAEGNSVLVFHPDQGTAGRGECGDLGRRRRDVRARRRARGAGEGDVPDGRPGQAGNRPDVDSRDPPRVIWIPLRVGVRRGRWQLGCRRDVLPAADELHANGWLGHVQRQLQQPRRPQRRGSQARFAESRRTCPDRTRRSLR